MKRTTKRKTTSIKDDLKNENDLKNIDDLHIAEMHIALDVFSFAVFLIVTNIYFSYVIV